MILSKNFVPYFGFRCIFRWSEFSDTLLVREILVIEPYTLQQKGKSEGKHGQN